ncbi:MAG: polysaccharide deacetylase family protein [Elusimicrobiota bacterium]
MRNSGYKILVIHVLLLILLGLFPAGVSANKKVMLTFDDGPHPGTTERILDILHRHDVHATFFLVGLMIDKSPGLVSKINKCGCEIGNHTYSDTRLTTLDREDVERSLDSVNDSLKKITGMRTSYFRPPGGRLNKLVSEVVREKGYHTVLWTRHVDDTSSRVSVKRIMRLATVNPGVRELIMLHDGPEETIDALPGIISFYKQRGYEFVLLSESVPPMFANMSPESSGLLRWPTIMWNEGAAEPVKTEKNRSVTGVAGIIAIFTSIGSTVCFIRFSRRGSKEMHASFVFLGARKKHTARLLDILEENGIKGTFFVSEEEADEVLSLYDEQLREHCVAYMKGEGRGAVKESLVNWQASVNNSDFMIMPFYYSADGYADRDVRELREEGFLPVDWKMPLPDRNTDDPRNLIRHVIKKLKVRSVIPIWGDSQHTVEALPELIKEISRRGYSILSLNDYLVKRYN